MPRDYVNSGKKEKKPGQLPGWVWMLGGLTIGLFVAFLVYLNNNTHPSQRGGLSKVIKDTIEDVRDVKKHPPAQSPPPPSKAPEKIAPKPRFDFYEILPEIEVLVPDQELSPGKEKTNPLDPNFEYTLQAGAFRSVEEADRLKAKLALQGVTGTIQTITNEKGTWHRVRIGPLRDLDTLNKTRSRLKQAGIDTFPVKSKT